jgi:transcriptional regulator with XRE-family HTH domain
MSRSLFGQTLGALIASKHGSGREFARICGVDSATISRLMAGDTRCSLENLRVFCEKISPDPLEQYELLLAHLHDEAAASGLDVSRLLLRHIEGVNLSELDLTPEMNGQLGVIARAAGEIPEVAESVEALSGLICRFRAMEADEKSGHHIPFEPLVAENKTPPASPSTESAIKNAAQTNLKATAPDQTPRRAVSRKRG